MGNATNQIEAKIILLKECRLQLLRLHKLLVDSERRRFEAVNGAILSGQFLNMLLNEQKLQWLRKFSTLIVDIDEMLDLDDGFGDEMLEKHFAEMRKIIKLKTPDEEFNTIYKGCLENNPEAADKNNEIIKLLCSD